MYQISRDTYNDMLESRNRKIEWHCTITLKDGETLNLDSTHIVAGVGELKAQCANNSDIAIGNAFASELTMQLLDVNIDRYRLYDGIISLYSTVYFDLTILNWDEALGLSWNDLSQATWGSVGRFNFHYDFPMGQFIIKEAMQTANKIKLTAYDFMILFDQKLPSDMDANAKSPYAWIETACEVCGVTLGTTRQELYYMPNGLRTVKFSNSNNEVKTWRDVLSEIVTVLGANATMSRQGTLLVKRYMNLAVDAITAGGRYSSEFSDFQSYYTGIYLSYREGNIQDYQTNAESAEEDTGLSYDIGYNSFMQIDVAATREAMLKEIIDAQKGLVFSPFSISMPMNPCFDLMDTLEFSGNQADPSRDIAPITSIVWRIGGKMDIACGGEDPTLQEAKSRESKAIDSIDSGGGGWENMWMVMGTAPEQDLVIHQNQAAIKVGEVMFYARDAKSMFQVAYTVNFVLDAAALIEITLFADNERIIKAEQNCFNGENVITVTSGQEVDGEGSHTVNAFIRVLASTLDITDLLPSATGEVF